jgi:hypothetical protein
MPARKTEIVSFKTDNALLRAMKGIANRSEFIRTAILNALDSTCPLCSGTGILTPSQMKHWDEFAEDHSLRECESCREVHLVCSNASTAATEKEGR